MGDKGYEEIMCYNRRKIRMKKIKEESDLSLKELSWRDVYSPRASNGLSVKDKKWLQNELKESRAILREMQMKKSEEVI